MWQTLSPSVPSNANLLFICHNTGWLVLFGFVFGLKERKKERTVNIRTVPRYTKGKIKTFVWTEVLIDSTHGGNILCAILFVSTPSQESECGRESGDLFDQFILKLSRMQQRKFYNFGQIWNELLFHSPVGFNFNFVIKSKQNSCCVTQLVEQSLLPHSSVVFGWDWVRVFDRERERDYS